MQNPGQEFYGYSGNQSQSNSRRGSVQRDFISSSEGPSGRRPSQPTSPMMSGRNTPNQYATQQQQHFYSPPTHYSGPPTPAMTGFSAPAPPEYYSPPSGYPQNTSSPSSGPLPSYAYASGQQGLRQAPPANSSPPAPSYSSGYVSNQSQIPVMEPSRSPHQTQAHTGTWSGESSSKQSIYAGAPIKLSSPPSRPGGGGTGSSPKTPQSQGQAQHSPGPAVAPNPHPHPHSVQMAAPVPQYPQGSPSGNVPTFPYPVQHQSQGSPIYHTQTQPTHVPQQPMPPASWPTHPQGSPQGGSPSNIPSGVGVGAPPAYGASRENSSPSGYSPNTFPGQPPQAPLHGSPTQNLPKQSSPPNPQPQLQPQPQQQPVAVTIGRIPVTPAPKVQVGVHAAVQPPHSQPQSSVAPQMSSAPQVQVQPRPTHPAETSQPSLPAASLYPIHPQAMQQAQPPRMAAPTPGQGQSEGIRQPTVLSPPDWHSAGYPGPNTNQAAPAPLPPPPPYEATPQSSPPPSGMQTPIHDEGNGDDRVCRHFLQGRCSWGASCRFEHPGAGSGSPPGAVAVASMAVAIPVGATNPPPLSNFPPPYSAQGYPNSSAPNSGFCSPEGGRSGAVSPTHPGTTKGFPLVTPTLSPSMPPMPNPSLISSAASTSTGYMQGPTVTPYTSGSPSLANSMNLTHQLPSSLLQQASPLGTTQSPGKEGGTASSGGVTFHSSSWTADMEIQIHRRQRSRPGSMPTSRTQSPKSVPLSPTESFGAIPPGFANAHSRPHSPSPATGVDPQSVIGSGASLGGDTRALPTSALTSGRSTPLVANQVKFAHNPYVKGERDRELLNYSAPNSMHTTPTTRPFDLPS